MEKYKGTFIYFENEGFFTLTNIQTGYRDVYNLTWNGARVERKNKENQIIKEYMFSSFAEALQALTAFNRENIINIILKYLGYHKGFENRQMGALKNIETDIRS